MHNHSNLTYTLYSNQLPFKYKPPPLKLWGQLKLVCLADRLKHLVHKLSLPFVSCRGFGKQGYQCQGKLMMVILIDVGEFNPHTSSGLILILISGLAVACD